MNYNKKLLQAVLVFLNQKAWADTATATVDATQANNVLILAVPVLIILLVIVFRLLATSKKSAAKPESTLNDFNKPEEAPGQTGGGNISDSEASSGGRKTQKNAVVSEKPDISPLSRLAALEAEVADEKSSNKKPGPSSEASPGEAKRTLKNKAVTAPPMAGRLADVDAAEKPSQPSQTTTPEKKPAPAPVTSAPVSPKAPEPVLAAEAPPVQPKEKLIFALEGDGKPYEAQGSIIRIGRKKENQICIPANEVSREHIEVTAGKGLVYVTPLTETNTTRLNGRSIKEKQVIKPGDTLNLGGLDFIVVKARAL